MFAVGFGGLCGCLRRNTPNRALSYVYTFGCTEYQYPELIIVASPATAVVDLKREMTLNGDDPSQAEEIAGEILRQVLERKLKALIDYQAKRHRPLRAGEHIHRHQAKGLGGCVELVAMPPAERCRFSLLAADERYGIDGYTALHVLMWGPDGKLQTDPACEIAIPTMVERFDA